jgi:hypothetical protein
MGRTLRRFVIKVVAAAAAGVAAELIGAVAKSGEKARQTGVRTSEAEEWVESVTRRAIHWAKDSDVSENVQEFCQRVLRSDVAEKTGSTASKIIDVARDRTLEMVR